MADLFGTDELEIKIKVITVDGKRMSRALFNQLDREKLIILDQINPDKTYTVKLNGNPLGYVLIDDKRYVIFVKNGELKKTAAYEDKKDFYIAPECLNPEIFNRLFESEHLFIGA